MRYAIISDIHANLQALSAVLARLESLGVDRLVCLGDVVGYGGAPSACIGLVRARCSDVILGNHDAAVVEKTSIEYFNPAARAATLWTRETLSDEERAWLESLPLTADPGGFAIVHATPDVPGLWRYLMSEDQAWGLFSCFEAPLLFYGHTHFPMLFECRGDEVLWREVGDFDAEDGSRYMVNVGSVGQPRDGNPRAAFGIWDSRTRRLEFHRQEYDIAGAQKDILDNGLPPVLAERLARGR